MAYSGPVINMPTSSAFRMGQTPTFSTTDTTVVGINVANAPGNSATMFGYRNNSFAVWSNGVTFGSGSRFNGSDMCVIGTHSPANSATSTTIGAANASNSSGVNICWNSPYTASNVLTIGAGTGTGNGQQNQAFISGIYGITTTSSTTSTVLCSNGDQLGTVSSSARFKENVADMGETPILSVRPVTFHYKAHTDNVMQYGLIAEEVNEIFPDLVNLDKEGIPFDVKYHDLPSILLNELIKLDRMIESLERRIAA